LIDARLRKCTLRLDAEFDAEPDVTGLLGLC